MLKRSFDWLLSLLGIIISSPLWLIISILIWWEDGRPFFFGQERVGKNGNIFKVIKFRTMKHSPTKPHLDIDLDLKKDSRLTKVGKFLRSTALDELPQLVNIFKGEMSFVGPRALPMKIDDKITHKYNRLDQLPGFKERIKVLPGLTGLSQIFDEKSMSLETKFKRDIEYVQTMNFWLDLWLILLSFWITFCGAWEKRGNKL
jgi:lipopolysaccharide/colanic/teichoic acid biosynthesis glycosyltransferase